jgi:predicted anti-sigma-YlaC factor YlaD
LSPCESLQSQAAALASLPATDPERIAAERHAADCGDCRPVLEEGRRLIRMLEALPEPAPPAPEVLRRAAEPILQELRRPPHPARWGNAVWNALPALSVVATWVVLLARQAGPVVGLIGIVSFAAVRASGALGWPSAAAILATSLGIAASQGWHELSGPLGGLTGFNCSKMELLVAVFPLVIALLAPRITGRAPSASVCAAAAAGGALVGQGALRLLCPLHDSAPHLLVFHVGGVLLAAGAGALASQIPIFRPATA